MSAYALRHSTIYQAMGKLQSYDNKSIKLSGCAQRKLRKTRHSNEWDIRITVEGAVTTDYIVKTIKDAKPLISWIYMGGEENGKASIQDWQTNQWNGSIDQVLPYNHHHICLVLYKDTYYQDVFNMFHLPPGWKHYMVPRNKKYTYEGWRLHARKPQTKTGRTSAVVYEYGTAPIDDNTEDNRRMIERMIRHYGRPEDKVRIGVVPRKRRTTEEIQRYTTEQKRRKIAKLQEQLKALQAQE